MLRLLSKHLTAAEQSFQNTQGGHKIIYIGPIKALVQERHNDWQTRYGSRLGLRCVQLTGTKPVAATADGILPPCAHSNALYCSFWLSWPQYPIGVRTRRPGGLGHAVHTCLQTLYGQAWTSCTRQLHIQQAVTGHRQ